MNLEVYIFFNGQCEEAMNFYKGIFGGELSVNRYGDMPSLDPKMGDVKPEWLMHSSLEGGDIKLMGSDTENASPIAKKISLSLGGTDLEKMSKVFDQLAEGGKVFMPLHKESWGDTFGSLTDKYGVEWMMNIGEPKA